MKYALRTRFGRDIVAQFLYATRPVKRHRAIILCDGMPTMPSKGPLLEFLAAKGYWVFHPRYRGTWESGGSFLAQSPERDIISVIDHLTTGFKDAWSGRTCRLEDPEVILIGSSFGGAAALLAGRDPRVSKVIVFSPVVDWTSESKAEPMSFLSHYTSQAFGQAYRGRPTVWKKLEKGDYFNPVRHASELDGRKVLIIHAKDDESVPWRPVAGFAKMTGSQLVLLQHGGHMGLGTTMEPKFYNRIKKFITL